MPNFDSRFWNLSQAAAWVVYRKRKLVEEFAEESADNWRALIVYPDMHKHKRVGDLDELVTQLEQGKLTAWGRRNDIEDKLEAIPAREWADLRIWHGLRHSKIRHDGHTRPPPERKKETRRVKKPRDIE